MKVIGISASPRKEKLTTFAIHETVNTINNLDSSIDTEFISLHDKKIEPCRACGFCSKNYSCAINDDFNAIIEQFKEDMPDALIMGTPVYMGSMTAQAKAFLDRSVVFRRNNFAFKNMIGAVVAVGGTRNGGQELTIQAVHAAMLIHGMIVAADSNPTAHFGGVGWERTPDGIENDKDAIATYHGVATRIVELLKKFK